jgi:hypothetical protein
VGVSGAGRGGAAGRPNGRTDRQIVGRQADRENENRVDASLPNMLVVIPAKKYL